MSFFRKNQPKVIQGQAHGRLILRDGSPPDQVFAKLTAMFHGTTQCIVPGVDRLIPLDDAPPRNGSRFEDYNWAGPRRPITITTWDPGNTLFAFKMLAPRSVEEKHCLNSWEHEIRIHTYPETSDTVVDVQLFVEHDHRVSLNPVRSLNINLTHIQGSVLGHSHVEKHDAKPGFAPSW